MSAPGAPTSPPNLSLSDAWAMLSDDPSTVLIDVRTSAEWNFVGVPDLSSVGKQTRLVEWIDYPHGRPNPRFVEQALDGVGDDAPILVVCRSGARSAAAGAALLAAGRAEVHNVVAGFEGDLDAAGHRHGGWKDSLPWRQG